VDQAKVSDSPAARRRAQALNDTFYLQPPPGRGSMQSRSYQELRQKIRMIRMEAGALSASLAKGEGHEETLPSYESLMQMVRDARRDAQQVFSTVDVQQKATAVRVILNQISTTIPTPYRSLRRRADAAAARPDAGHRQRDRQTRSAFRRDEMR
jgi:hypothetical protein